MFQNLVITGLTPLCNVNEIKNWDNRPFNGKWPENKLSSVRGTEIKKPIRKKPKRVRTAYSTDQIRALEKIYSNTKYIDAKSRKQLAETLNIGDKALKIWFQNRRMKEKKESSESSCDTSSEIVSCQSPISTNEVEKKEDANISYPYYAESIEPEKYTFPNYYCQNCATGQCYQNGYSHDPNVASFGADNCVYPTQYYPVDNHYNNVDLNSYNQVPYAYVADSWYAKSYDFSYYNTQQA